MTLIGSEKKKLQSLLNKSDLPEILKENKQYLLSDDSTVLGTAYSNLKDIVIDKILDPINQEFPGSSSIGEKYETLIGDLETVTCIPFNKRRKNNTDYLQFELNNLYSALDDLNSSVNSPLTMGETVKKIIPSGKTTKWGALGLLTLGIVGCYNSNRSLEDNFEIFKTEISEQYTALESTLESKIKTLTENDTNLNARLDALEKEQHSKLRFYDENGISTDYSYTISENGEITTLSSKSPIKTIDLITKGLSPGPLTDKSSCAYVRDVNLKKITNSELKSAVNTAIGRYCENE